MPFLLTVAAAGCLPDSDLYPERLGSVDEVFAAIEREVDWLTDGVDAISDTEYEDVRQSLCKEFQESGSLHKSWSDLFPEVFADSTYALTIEADRS